MYVFGGTALFFWSLRWVLVTVQHLLINHRSCHGMFSRRNSAVPIFIVVDAFSQILIAGFAYL